MQTTTSLMVWVQTRFQSHKLETLVELILHLLSEKSAISVHFSDLDVSLD